MRMNSKYLFSALCVAALGLSTGAFIKANAAPEVAAVAQGQPIDLTYAAEKALPAVVHIKFVQNSEVRSVAKCKHRKRRLRAAVLSSAAMATS